MKQQSTELKKFKKKVSNLEFELKQAKLALATINQLKMNLVAAKEARDATYAAATQAHNKAAVVGAQRDKALQNLTELQAATCGLVYEQIFNRGINRAEDNYNKKVVELHHGIYMEGWLAFLTKLGVPADNPVWVKVALEVELLDSPEPTRP